MSLGMLHPDRICNDKLWNLAEPLPTTARHEYLDLWQQLRSENAPLRVIHGGKLVSAPISFFDTVLMSYVTDDWQKVSRIVGPAMVSQMDVRQTDDMVLAARLNALAEGGLLEIRGESALEIFRSEVRLPKAQ
jgi:hypothetical protein